MNPGELRTSSRLVASVITIGLGFYLKDTAPGSETSWWPFVLMGYGVVSSLLTWTLGGIGRSEFHLVGSALTALLCIPPAWFGGRWLASSAYDTLAYGAWILIGISVLHLLIAIGLRGRK
jgi:hypothetical protein